MLNIVLDTNCLLLCLPPKSPYFIVWDSFLEGRIYLCVSNGILDEYAEILERRWGYGIALYTMNVIENSPFVRHIDPTFNYHFVENDPKDDKFVDCALFSNADFIVTQDHHFNVLKEIDFPKIEVITIRQLTEML